MKRNRLTLIFLVFLVSANFHITLGQAGSLDTTFNALGSGPNQLVHGLAVQNDGKIVIGGDFTEYNGTSINRIARLNPDGSLDPTFNVGSGASVLYNPIYDIAIQNNGKIIIVGNFEVFNGTSVDGIVRLNTDGSIDNSFSPWTINGNSAITGSPSINSVALQSDGSILVAGVFNAAFISSNNYVLIRNLARLNSDGSLDTTFNANTGGSGYPNDFVHVVTVQNDGKILIGGDFTSYKGMTLNHIARLNQNGSIDQTFNIGTGINSNGRVYSISIQQNDGKILIGGDFTSYNGTSSQNLVRLNSSGTIDNSFNTNISNSIRKVDIEDSGKILTASSNGVERVNPDGSNDTSFTNGIDVGGLYNLTQLGDGKILIAGQFTGYNGYTVNNLARLTNTCDLTTVNGTITNSSNQALANSKVLLIEFDPADSTLTVADSTYTDGSGNYTFSNVQDNHYIKAIPDSATYPGDIPTYYLNSVVFQFAEELVCGNQYDFTTIGGNNPGGSGFVSGQIGSGAGKTGEFGQPLINTPVFLMNTNNEPVDYTLTNEDGYFEFNNIACDEYDIWVDDAKNIINSLNKVRVDLTENCQQDSLRFTIKNKELEITDETTAIKNELANNMEFSVFPNPSNSRVYLDVKDQDIVESITLMDLTGSVLVTYPSYIRSFDVSDLSAGIYFLSISDGNQISTIKLLVGNN